MEFTSIEQLQATKFGLQAGTISATSLIHQGFQLKDCEWIAYYMGALAHFIGDAQF